MARAHRRGFGGLFHLINHAAGLVELAQFGYRGLAHRGLPAHHRHVRLWRSLPVLDDELGRLERAKHDPHTPAYWEHHTSTPWSGWLTHRIKTLYGFSTILSLVDNKDQRRQAASQFLYLMA